MYTMNLASLLDRIRELEQLKADAHKRMRELGAAIADYEAQIDAQLNAFDYSSLRGRREGVSQSSIARAAAVTTTMVSRVETNGYADVPVSPEAMQRILQAYYEVEKRRGTS